MQRLSRLLPLLLVAPVLAFAQQPASRLLQPIDPNALATLQHSVSPRLARAADLGPLDPATPITGITLYFQPSPAQKAALDALVQAQQTPGSPLYHAWLTPAEYAARFGLSNADLAKVESWLNSQGFNIDRVANSHTSITVSGTAALVESAFGTQLHRYQLDGETHFANATDLQIPAALSGILQSVRNLSDFRPRPQILRSSIRPEFTAKGTGQHFLTPKDVATIYDIDAAYNSGYNGSGVTIAVVGQSEISKSDIEAFQTAAGLTVKDPDQILVPSSGTATAVQGDEAESDLDIEYSGGIAPGATIDFVYTGNAKNYNVYDSLQYAIDNKLGSVISMSYGTCETELDASSFASLDAILEQGASQGQSILAASGDTGSTACFDPGGSSGLTTAQQEALAVNYPASSAYATGVGGTEFPSADVSSSNSTYWQSSSGSDVISSALSYIPEQVWNDDSAAIGQQYGAAYALSAGGGGTSAFTKRPSWQTGVPGIPSGTYRLVPDVSLDASADNAGYLYCTSDQSSWNSGQKASCNSGFRDASSQDLTIGGGTSFATPIFAGLLAIVNQKQSSTGLGLVNPTLYSLASNATTYASAFHDITSGTNACTAGATYCSSAGASGYAATTGYDEASGLGSVDFYNLLTAWSGTSGGSGGSGGTTKTFTLAAGNISVAQGSSGTSTATVTSQNAYAGTVSFALTSSATSLEQYGCYTIPNATVAANGTATSTLTVYTSQSACSSLTSAEPASVHTFGGGAPVASSHPPAPAGRTIPLGAAAFAGLLFLGFRRIRRSAWTWLSCLLLVAVLGLSTGCGSNSGTTTSSSSTGSTSTDVAKGSYTLTLTGTDTATSTVTASTTLTLTVN